MEKLASHARSLIGIELTQKQISLFEHYAIELISWNQKTNLTTIIDPRDIVIKHFLDSLSCMLAIQIPDHPTRALRLVDVGSGAGFPTLPLKIACPILEVTLVDSSDKKCDFLRYIVRELELDGVEVLHERAENLGSDSHHRESYNWALARYVAQMPVLFEYLLPLTDISGYCIAQKGKNAIAETQEAQRALDVLGGKVCHILPIELPDLSEKRHLVVVHKQLPTPEKYPRRPGMPRKCPLV